ncbi:MAG: peptide-methionine (S)-S-oxide reductase MsrA [Candidatus Pseudomonas phytovorans]|uniref:Peptide methionine sulfoxide reductase MsrA n=1 Tax=Candidatus Pseudomonas phytovorans TaxID=3121377 RepID=A0AAJ6B9M0_9PSED|nr:peptide-methionine (S)-S-oxide reductase MsrA [Pseudomonas sp.]WEK28833.1 MAG: peptide-methionine (S)-S-oxide reductase MsrA [Pseudomonas sp.]
MRIPFTFGGTALSLLAAGLIGQCSMITLARAEGAVVIAPPALDEATQAQRETAVFAGGCFWGVQGVFQHVKGVQQAISGYASGAANTAHYDQVSDGDTGHAESVEVTFDPAQVSYGTLLQIYFSVAHNPTELNRQGPDHGTQYRSAVFPESGEQQKVAQAYIAQLDATHVFGKPIVTKVETFNGFYPAEDEHQDFLTRYPLHPYIVINDLPKVARLKQLYPDRYQEQAVLVGGQK